MLYSIDADVPAIATEHTQRLPTSRMRRATHLPDFTYPPEAAKRPPAMTPSTLPGDYTSVATTRPASLKAVKAPKSRKDFLKRQRRPYKKPRKTHPNILGPITHPEDIRYHNMAVSPLLSLPAELRRTIWEYALTSSTGSLIYDSTKQRFDVSSIGAGLLTTCHVVALETMYLPLQVNKLLFKGPSLANVDFLAFLARLNRLEAALGWVLDIDVRFLGKDGLG